MTSAQLMQPGALAGRIVTVLPALIVLGLLAGCSARLEPPRTLASPSPTPQVWAVAPLANESGVSAIDGARVADLFMQEAQQVHGINMLPVNRVIQGMRVLDIQAVSSPGEAMTLMNVLGVDGLIVGTITAYGAYPPFTLGMAVELHLRSRGEWDFDARSISRITRGNAAPGEMGPLNPVAQAAGVFNAENHQTLQWLAQYAAGRSMPDSAYGDDIYLVRMELYTRFVSHRLMQDLLIAEQIRLASMAENPTER